MLISLLITLLVVAIIVYVINLILTQLALPPVVKTIAYLIIGVIVLVYLLHRFGVSTGGTALSGTI